MATVTSAEFLIERGGAPVTISGLEFVSATGRYAAPDAAEALLEVKAGSTSARLGTVGIGPRVWLTDPLTGRWSELEEGTGFNPATVFDPAEGWPAILTTDLSGGVASQADGRYILRGTVAAERVATLTVGLVDPQPTEIEFVIDPETRRLLEVRFDTVTDGARSTWSIEIDEYDVPVTIAAPVE